MFGCLEPLGKVPDPPIVWIGWQCLVGFEYVWGALFCAYFGTRRPRAALSGSVSRSYELALKMRMPQAIV